MCRSRGRFELLYIQLRGQQKIGMRLFRFYILYAGIDNLATVYSYGMRYPVSFLARRLGL